MLLLYLEHSSEDILAAVELALERRISFSAGVRHTLLHARGAPKPAPLNHWPTTVLPDLSIYDQLGRVP